MDHIFTFCVFKAGSKTEFANNSLKSPKIGKLPQGLLIHEKTRIQKSHATVPLRGYKQGKVCSQH